ncbi:hypothetical protein, partial [Marinobacter sp. UBA2678]|uniref:hypothetical protein n=1 Tax=Marinobacter sp. UBA2678 TaxID=1946815 RepID=UPI00257A80C3
GFVSNLSPLCGLFCFFAQVVSELTLALFISQSGLCFKAKVRSVRFVTRAQKSNNEQIREKSWH